MIDTSLSHFKITAKLGEGGMGPVYRAEDLELKRRWRSRLWTFNWRGISMPRGVDE